MKNPKPRDVLRKRLEGMTQAALADELGIKQSYLSDILNFRREAGPRVLKALGLTKIVTYREIEDGR